MSGVADGNGSGRPQRLAAILHRFRVDRIDDPILLEQLQEAALDFISRTVVQQRFLRRMTPPAAGPVTPIEWIDAKELAVLLHRSESTVRHLPPDAIPGRRQAKKGYRVAWNKQVVLSWLAECSSQ